ncbi:MAG: hypothetical protein WC346_17970 [Methanogenium sp.]
MLPNNFCIFILSHGRPDKIHTLRTFERQKYTGRYYILIDNDDKTKDEYVRLYGDKIIIFDKKKVTVDRADNFNNMNLVVFARNYCFELAKKLKIKYFMEFDDDYTDFGLRFNVKGEFKHIRLYNTLDDLFEKLLKFYKNTKSITSLSFAQNGDFIGGQNSAMGVNILMRRKAMNTQICSNERPFTFLGGVNEDVNAYVRWGSEGKLFFTISCVSIGQVQTQSSSGGLTEIYKDQGTYVKSFYSVIYCPSCVRIIRMGAVEKRIHHKILWKKAVPCILREEHKKLF